LYQAMEPCLWQHKTITTVVAETEFRFLGCLVTNILLSSSNQCESKRAMCIGLRSIGNYGSFPLTLHKQKQAKCGMDGFTSCSSRSGIWKNRTHTRPVPDTKLEEIGAVVEAKEGAKVLMRHCTSQGMVSIISSRTLVWVHCPSHRQPWWMCSAHACSTSMVLCARMSV